MSYNIIYPAGGLTTVTVAALDAIAVKTSGTCKIYQVVGYPQYPNSRTLLSDLSNGIYFYNIYDVDGNVLHSNKFVVAK